MARDGEAVSAHFMDQVGVAETRGVCPGPDGPHHSLCHSPQPTGLGLTSVKCRPCHPSAEEAMEGGTWAHWQAISAQSVSFKFNEKQAGPGGRSVTKHACCSSRGPVSGS